MATCAKCGKEHTTGQKRVVRDHSKAELTVAFICIDCLKKED